MPSVLLETSKGVIKLELYPDKAPITVENFLTYVREGHYDGLIFHRVIGDSPSREADTTKRCRCARPPIRRSGARPTTG